jgi:hypothetical protein
MPVLEFLVRDHTAPADFAPRDGLVEYRRDCACRTQRTIAEKTCGTTVRSLVGSCGPQAPWRTTGRAARAPDDALLRDNNAAGGTVGVSEPQRLALYRTARAALGEHKVYILMARSPRAKTDIETQQNVEYARALMSTQIAEMWSDLKADVAEAKGALKKDIRRMGSRTLRWTVITRCTRASRGRERCDCEPHGRVRPAASRPVRRW